MLTRREKRTKCYGVGTMAWFLHSVGVGRSSPHRLGRHHYRELCEAKRDGDVHLFSTMTCGEF